MHSHASVSAPARAKYDPRLWVDVWRARDPSLYAGLDIPRSMRSTWRKRRPPERIVGVDLFDRTEADLRQELDALKRRAAVLEAVVRLLVTLVRVLGVDFRNHRLPDGRDKARILHAVERASKIVGVAAALRIVGLSPSRYHDWRGRALCLLDDQRSCPRRSPTKLRFTEIQTIGDMVLDKALRHMSTAQLALYAQRIGRLFVSASSWYHYMRERGWKRPLVRLHFPPRTGIRASRPNEVWHVDETVVRLASGAHLYIQAIVDNFSRFILAWRVSSEHGGPWSLQLLRKAETLLRYSEPPPKLVCDKGGENFNEAVNDHVLGGVLKRILARVDILSSNSLIERFWMALKHQCLYLHGLATEAEVTERTAFFVQQHNQVAPQVALRGRTPEEAYFRLALDLPAQLAAARDRARRNRIDHNRNLSCAACAPDRDTTGPPTTDTRVGPRERPAGEESTIM